MNKIPAALLVLILLFVNVACGGNSQQNPVNSIASAAATPPPIGGGAGSDTGSGGSGSGSGSGGGCGAGLADYYVATNGNDNWSGKIDAPASDNSDGPFATLDRARRAVRGMPGGKHTVMVRGGTYFLSAPLSFSAADSGSAAVPVVYQAYPCETPIISGGKPVGSWTNISGNVWTARVTGYQNFEGLFYNGQRRYRPRTTPNTFLYNAGPVYTSTSSTNCSVQVNGQYECFDRFYFNGNDVASNYHSLALGDVEILDFENWTMSRMRLKSVDAASHIAYLTGATTQDAHHSGFMSGHRYLIENVKEALTQPGQWYLDRCANPPACTSSTGTWTLTYLAQAGENPSTAQIIVPQQVQLVIANNLQHVTFRGLTFSHDNWLSPAAGLGDFQGSPGVSAALSFTNSSNIVFESVTIDHTQGWGVEFVSTAKGTSTSNQVINSALYDLGGGGIRIGRIMMSRDTDANVPQYNLIQNNLIAGGGRVTPSGIGTGIWVGNSHHNTVTHNEIYDFYTGAIQIGFKLNISTGVGNAHDNLVSHNLLYNLGQGVTSDMGGIYFATSATIGNQVLNNVIHDVTHNWQDAEGYGAHGIYFDQGTSNVVARNNLVYRTSGAAFFQNMSDVVTDTFPTNNVVDNNIFAFGNKTIQRGGDNPASFSFTHNIVYYDVAQLQGGKWSCSDVGKTGQPVPCSTRFYLDYNTYWNVSGSLMFITTDPSTYVVTRHNFSEWQNMGEDMHSVIQDPLFANPNYPNDDFTVQASSTAFSRGFVPFSYSQAGRTTNAFTPPVVPPAFPLQVMSPTAY
ncbi:MAG TPA: right-handed parallel beta-helix repeat-containing protein [Terriglobales bacterium]|nr:right-handed parallel beta-helix repeat-containing protein [Terriglobales bacterium]